MNNFFPISRNYLKEFSSQISKSKFSNTRYLMMHLLVEAQHEDGFIYGVRLKRGQLLRGRSALSSETGLSEKEIRVAIKNLVILSEISVKRANERANETNVITCLNYDIWCCSENSEGQRKGQRRANEGPTKGHIQEVQEVQEYKEVDQNLSPDGDGMASSTTPPPAKISPPRKRKGSEPTDPLTNPNIFLHRVEAEYPDTVIVWKKDVGAIKTLLAGRKRGGVPDPQAETWGNWVRFIAGDVDDAITMRRRAHDITAFVGHYALLVETNGKSTHKPAPPDSVYDKMARWAEKMEREAEQAKGETK